MVHLPTIHNLVFPLCKQIPANWMLPEGEPYIRRLPWSYIPHAHNPHAPHFIPSVTHVGTKHAMQSPATSPQYTSHMDANSERNGVASPDNRSEGPWADVNGGQEEGMSFDEMLALSIMVRFAFCIDFRELHSVFNYIVTFNLQLLIFVNTFVDG